MSDVISVLESTSFENDSEFVLVPFVIEVGGAIWKPKLSWKSLEVVLGGLEPF